MGDWGQFEDIEGEEENDLKTPLEVKLPMVKQSESKKLAVVLSDPQLNQMQDKFESIRREATLSRLDTMDIGDSKPHFGSLQAAHQRILDSGLTFSEAKGEIWKLRKGGWMLKRGFKYRKRWVRRYVELSGRMLKYYETMPKDESTISRGCLELTKLTKVVRINDLPNFKYAFNVIPESGNIANGSWIQLLFGGSAMCSDPSTSSSVPTPPSDSQIWRFVARNEIEREDWIHMIEKSIHLIKRVEVKPTLSGVGSVHNHYRIGVRIGRGKFGDVFAAVAIMTEQEYAIKVVNKEKQVKTKDDAMMLRSEIKILRKVTREVDHMHICKLYQAYEDNFMVYLVMERLDGGDLLDHVSKCCKSEYSEPVIATIIRQVSGALSELHKIGIVVCDLQPKSILFASPSSNIVKLHEFGRAINVNTAKHTREDKSSTFSPGMVNKHQYRSKLLGTLEYLAPEVLSYSDYSPMSDVWSLGVLLFVMLSGRSPFKRQSRMEMTQSILRGLQADQLSPDDWKDISLPARQLVGSMLNLDRSRRISAADILSNNWILNPIPVVPHLEACHGRLSTLATNAKSNNDIRHTPVESATVTADMLRSGTIVLEEGGAVPKTNSSPNVLQSDLSIKKSSTFLELLKENNGSMDLERRAELLALDVRAEKVRRNLSSQLLGDGTSSHDERSQANFMPAGRFLTDLEGQMRMVRDTEQSAPILGNEIRLSN